jgi:hypothetical protein
MTAKCDYGTGLLGDEFANAAVDVVAETRNFDSCSAMAMTSYADDAVWAACSGGSISGVGSGYTLGANDNSGDLSEYKLTSDSAKTPESTSFSTVPSSPDWSMMTVATLKPM